MSFADDMRILSKKASEKNLSIYDAVVINVFSCIKYKIKLTVEKTGILEGEDYFPMNFHNFGDISFTSNVREYLNDQDVTYEESLDEHLTKRIYLDGWPGIGVGQLLYGSIKHRRFWEPSEVTCFLTDVGERYLSDISKMAQRDGIPLDFFGVLFFYDVKYIFKIGETKLIKGIDRKCKSVKMEVIYKWKI